MKFKIFALILSIFLAGQTVFAGPFNANAKTKRIPAGTKFNLKLMNSMATVGCTQGTDFSAILITDQTEDTDIILPSGSIVRGTIRKIVPAKRLSKGAIMYMDFDHVVTPNGRQVPLSMNIVGRTDLTYDGGITTTRGYGDAFKKTWATTVDITRNSVNWGDETFDEFAGGYFRILTLPLSAVGGVVGSAGYFVYDSVADAIRKGKDVYLDKGTVLNVILVQPIDVPVI